MRPLKQVYIERAARDGQPPICVTIRGGSVYVNTRARLLIIDGIASRLLDGCSIYVEEAA